MLPLIGAVAPSLIGGLFGMGAAKKARRQALYDARHKFEVLRDAAIRGGFNPLTALQATGGAGYGAFPSSAPPLASVELLTGALQGAADEITGEAAQRRAADRLNLELAQLRLDQARSGVVAYAPPSAAAGIGGGPSPLGRSASVTATASGGTVAGVIFGDRPITEVPVSNTSGGMVVQNGLTAGEIVVPGDSEPWGIDELLSVAVVGAPQIAWNWAREFGRTASFGLKRGSPEAATAQNRPFGRFALPPQQQ